jgi:hypothetical protein
MKKEKKPKASLLISGVTLQNNQVYLNLTVFIYKMEIMTDLSYSKC